MNTRAKKTLRTLGIMCFGICTIVGLAACQPEVSNAPELSAQKKGGLIEDPTISLPVRFKFAEDSMKCEQSITIDSQPWRVNHLAFFVSNMAVKAPGSDSWQSITFIANDWQTEGTSLQWFNSNCDVDGNTSSNQSLAINDPQGLWHNASEVKFELAVPFAENHQNPLTQPSPLNISEMFWSWRLGHKFLRLDLQADSVAEPRSWSYHLGSVGCQSASSMRAPAEPCSIPNRFEMVLQKTTKHNALSFNLLELLKNVDPAAMRSCMFQQVKEVACVQLANNLHNGEVFRFYQTTLPN